MYVTTPLATLVLGTRRIISGHSMERPWQYAPWFHLGHERREGGDHLNRFCVSIEENMGLTRMVRASRRRHELAAQPLRSDPAAVRSSAHLDALTAVEG